MRIQPILKNFGAILAGTLTAAAIFWIGLFVTLLMTVGKLNRDSSGNALSASRDLGFIIICSFTVAAGFCAGLVTAKLSAGKKYYSSLVSALLLLLMLFYISDFGTDSGSLTIYACAVIPVMAGAYFVLRKR